MQNFTIIPGNLYVRETVINYSGVRIQLAKVRLLISNELLIHTRRLKEINDSGLAEFALLVNGDGSGSSLQCKGLWGILEPRID